MPEPGYRSGDLTDYELELLRRQGLISPPPAPAEPGMLGSLLDGFSARDPEGGWRVPPILQSAAKTAGNPIGAAIDVVPGLLGATADEAVRMGKGWNDRVTGRVPVMDPTTGRTTQGSIELGTDIAANVAGGGTAANLGRGGAKNVVSMSGAKPKPKRSTELKNLRDMPRDKAISEARKEPHLIPSTDKAEGAYVGGPRNIKSRKELLRQRRSIDKQIERGAEGADWYDRYRAGVEEVTGGDPKQMRGMVNQHGQYSAGVSPESELGYATKELNDMIAKGAGSNEPRTKVARPAQLAASSKAFDADDPTKFQLGKKTGEYAGKNYPDPNRVEGATGVNDFRWAREHGYTEPDGSPQRNAVGPAAHTYMDYETALAADRASKSQSGGFSRWTGEMVQAAPWVAQKADDLFAERQKFYTARAKDELGAGVADDVIMRRGWDYAFDDAKKTIADFFPKHTAYETYEAQPYAGSGHLPGLLDAPYETRKAFADDPLSDWAIAPGGRDAIYSGMRFQGPAGPSEHFAMRVRPTAEMQGVYTPPSGATEYNPGRVARPLVGFDSLPDGTKGLPASDRSLLEAGAATRAYMDVQGAGAAQKPWVGGKVGDQPNIFLRKEQVGPLPGEEMARLQEVGKKYGLPDVVDVNEGVSMTDFANSPSAMDRKQLKQFLGEVNKSGMYNKSYRTKMDSVYQSFEGDWEKGVGSGAATNKYLEMIDKLPRGTVQALDNNPYLAEVAVNRMKRDEKWSKIVGDARPDIQNVYKIIADGPGWLGRLRAAARSGKVSLPAVTGIIVGAEMVQREMGGGDETY